MGTQQSRILSTPSRPIAVDPRNVTGEKIRCQLYSYTNGRTWEAVQQNKIPFLTIGVGDSPEISKLVPSNGQSGWDMARIERNTGESMSYRGSSRDTGSSVWLFEQVTSAAGMGSYQLDFKNSLTGRDDELKIVRTNWQDYQIIHQGDPVALLKKLVEVNDHSFDVTVAPNVDAGLIIAIGFCIVQYEIEGNKERYGTGDESLEYEVDDDCDYSRTMMCIEDLRVTN